MNPLWSNIFRRTPGRDTLAEFLGRAPFFSDFSLRELARLEKLVHVRHFTPGEMIFAEGERGSGMYLIRAGRVKIFTGVSDHEEEELAVLSAGDFFGETALVVPAPRTATAVALETCELIGLFRGDLEDLAQRLPKLTCKLLFGLNRVLSQRLVALSSGQHYGSGVILSPLAETDEEQRHG